MAAWRRPALAELWTEGRGAVLLAVSIGWFLSVGTRMVYPAVLPRIQATFDVGLTLAGLLVTLVYLAYALGQFPGGILCDAVGDRRMLVVSTAVTTAAVALTAVAPTFGIFVVAAMCFGFATALYAPARFTILSATYPRRDGTAIGITLAAGNAGNAALPTAAGIVAGFASWRLGFGLLAPIFVATVLLLLAALPEGKSSRRDGSGISRSLVSELLAAMSRPSVLLVGAALLAINAVWQAFTGLFPTYLVATKGLSEPVAAAMLGLFFASGTVVQPLSGSIGDVYDPRATLAVLLGLATAGLVALPFVDSLPALVAVTVAISFLLGSSAITFPYLLAALPASVRGSGVGFTRTVYMAVASLGPVMVGALGEAGHFDGAFSLLAGFGVVAILLVVRLPAERSRS